MGTAWDSRTRLSSVKLTRFLPTVHRDGDRAQGPRTAEGGCPHMTLKHDREEGPGATMRMLVDGKG